MKKIVSLFIAFVLVISMASLSTSAIMAGSPEVNVWDGTTATGFSGGTGLQNDPYIIKTGAELDLIASTCMGGETYADTYFRLEADIDWGGNTWTPIGYDTKNLFAGHFDGNGQTIFNLECFEVYSGLFGVIKEGSIKNLKVDYATFTTDTRYCGAIAAWMKLTTIEGVSVGENVKVRTADISSDTAQMGGCFGLVHSSTIQGATFYGEVEAPSIAKSPSFIGGIAGVVGGEASVKYCVNYGKVSNPNAPVSADYKCYVGGIVGGIGASSAIGTVEYCVNYGEVVSYEIAGGIAGRIHVDNSVMKNCFNLGTVTAPKAGTVLGHLSKLYVMEGNCGVESSNATKAIGDDPGSDKAEYKSPTDSNIKVASESSISLIQAFSEAAGQTAALVPIFNLVKPSEPAQTTEPETTEEVTTEAPETTEKPEETKAPETAETTEVEEEKTDAPTPEQTKAPETAPAPAAPKKGCGGTVGIAAFILCILPLAFVAKKH